MQVNISAIQLYVFSNYLPTFLNKNGENLKIAIRKYDIAV